MGSHGNGANQLSHGDLLISRELIESTLELIADRLVFLLLLDQVGFKFITFLLEFSGLSPRKTLRGKGPQPRKLR